MNPLSIVLIDDEESQLISLESFLKRRGHEVFTATDGKQGVEYVRRHTIDLVLTDLRMPDWDGRRVLQEVKAINPEIDVVLITAYGSVEDAVSTMKSGAYDFLTKPVDLDLLEGLIRRVQEKRVLQRENRLLRQQLQQQFSFDAIVSRSPEMEALLNTAGRVANSKATVLIRGESGTGKELIARAVHFASPRKHKPFVVVNVAALPDNLIESELFGHEKGAFTGAIQRRIGRFEEADGGTLFIDEVGDIPLSVQVKLLRVLQFGTIQRIGSNQSIQVDVRIIAATHRDLEAMIRENQFREDLYYRLNVVTLEVPPLRKRKSDIPVLAEHFLRKYASEYGRNIRGITREALDRLMKYDFPGNVRELENMIQRAVVLCRDEFLTADVLLSETERQTRNAALDPDDLSHSYEEKLRAFETALIQRALAETNGNQSAAARLLQMTERHLRSRMQRLGLK